MKTLQQLIDEREELEKLSGAPWHIGHIKDEDNCIPLMDVDDCDGCAVANNALEHHAKYIAFTSNHDKQIIDGLLEVIRKKDRALGLIDTAYNRVNHFTNGHIYEWVHWLGKEAKQALEITTDTEKTDG